ncbi:unnamed protein product [Allacma fusca]|uniref:Uncharacterized protein n=1 Tax=Allacma fusca TaxID=39272 RepID=A0A8J2PMW2_9HEXA|nr:unnamed protein product [Allacma fusca]
MFSARSGNEASEDLPYSRPRARPMHRKANNQCGETLGIFATLMPAIVNALMSNSDVWTACKFKINTMLLRRQAKLMIWNLRRLPLELQRKEKMQKYSVVYY